MRAEVRIEGMAEVTRKLREIGASVSNSLEGAGTKGMLVIEGDARERVPVDIGNLGRSIITKTTQKTQNSVEIATGTNLEYAPYVEYGTGIYAENGKGRKTPWMYYYVGTKGPEGWRFTRGQRHQPYLRPAFDTKKDRVVEVIKEDLNNAIQGAL